MTKADLINKISENSFDEDSNNKENISNVD